MANNPVGWFEIYVDDMERAKSFYEAVFETSLTKIDDPTGSGVVMFGFPTEPEAHGAPGALVQMEPMPAGANSVLVYFSCEDCANEESRAEGAGGSVEHSKMSIGEYGFVSHIRDTEGNMIGLHSLA